MLNKNIIIQKIEQNKEKIRSFGVKSITLVGSYARNKQKEHSDIDLVIEFQKGRGLFDDFIHLLHFLQDCFRKNIDLVEKSLIREELEPYLLGGDKIEAKI